MTNQQISVALNEWHDLVIEMRGKELTVRIDGGPVLTHHTHSGDEAKISVSVSVANELKSATAEAWFDDVSFEPLEKKE